MSELTYHQRCFGWASGHYLADEVDKTFWELDYEEQLEFLENNAWEPFEDYPGKDIYQVHAMNRIEKISNENPYCDAIPGFEKLTMNEEDG